MKLSQIMPVGSGEKIQYLAHDFNDNTIRFILHYPGILRADILCAATHALVSSVNILHASFIPGALSAYWHINSDYVESDYFSYIASEKNPLEAALEASLHPMLPSGKVQLHCTLAEGNSECALSFNISHLCVDGSDGKYLLSKLVEAYNLIAETGSAKNLVIKNGNRAAEQIYQELSAKEYLSLMKNPISRVKSSFPFSTSETGELRIVRQMISSEIMEYAHRRAKETNATINDILLAACYRAYAALPEIDEAAPMSIMSMMDLRQHCKNGESDGLCNMSGSLPTTLEQGIGTDFSDTLAQVAALTRVAKANPLAGLEGMPLLHGVTRALPMGLLLQIAERVYGSMSIGLTNLGNIPCTSLALDGLIPDEGIFGGPLKKKPAMQISATSFDKATALSIVGEYTQTDATLLQAMLNHMTEEITDYATNNNTTANTTFHAVK